MKRIEYQPSTGRLLFFDRDAATPRVWNETRSLVLGGQEWFFRGVSASVLRQVEQSFEPIQTPAAVAALSRLVIRLRGERPILVCEAGTRANPVLASAFSWLTAVAEFDGLLANEVREFTKGPGRYLYLR